VSTIVDIAPKTNEAKQRKNSLIKTAGAAKQYDRDRKYRNDALFSLCATRGALMFQIS